MRLMAVVPVRNEAHRYLQACLTHLYRNVGVTNLLVVDDGSTDDTFEVARQTLQYEDDRRPSFDRFCGPSWRVHPRPDDVATFLRSESDFRSWMLQELVRTFRPKHQTDWILVNDADEFLCSWVQDSLPQTLQQLAEGTAHADCLMFGLDELWQLDPPLRRVDKAWGTQRQARMFRYREDRAMLIPPKVMASGCMPVYAREAALDVYKAIRIVHAGYAHPDDRRPKYDRYSKHPGHSAEHIESILDSDIDLIPIGAPDIWRGVR